jgi:cytoskeletal protein RodZ
MGEELRSFGETFKLRRQEMGLSLKEVENATSIRMSYLQLIEEGAVDKLISPVYASGFVRQYAAFLGLDGEQVIKEHPELFIAPKPQEFSYGIGTLEARGNPSAGIKWFPNALWLLVTVALGALAWMLAHYLEVL